MRISGKNGFALLLIACGGLILLGRFGGLFHGLFGLLFPFLLMGLGYLGIKNGRSLIGWTLFAIGFLVLLPRLTWLIGLLIAVGFIIYGISMLTKRSDMEV